jgi:molybdate transport system regulatory protein
MKEPVNFMKRRRKNLHYSFRLYLNADEKRILGKGGAQILDAIDEHRSIAAAAEELEMSYRFVWDYLSRIRERLGRPIIVTRRGGTLHEKRKGGGETTLTPLARVLLKDYWATERLLHKALIARKGIPATTTLIRPD